MKFWEGKKTLVTGGRGFIGSHLVELLAKEGAEVTVPIRSDTRYLGNNKNIRLVYGDLQNMDFCSEVCKNKDIVMNLAADVGGIEYNIRHQGSIFRNNLSIFMNILDASRINDIERFLTVSSACVYPRHCIIPTPEEEGFIESPDPSNEGYGWAKRMEEFLSIAYSKEYNMNIAIARPYNAYGPRDNFDPNSGHVIPALIRRVMSGENPLIVWGSGEQTRSFLYAEDFARGLMIVTEKYCKADPVNIGSDEEVKIKDLANLIVKLSGKKTNIIFDDSKPSGQPRRSCSTKKLFEKTGFKTKVPLEEGIKRTIEWYRKNKTY